MWCEGVTDGRRGDDSFPQTCHLARLDPTPASHPGPDVCDEPPLTTPNQQSHKEVRGCFWSSCAKPRKYSPVEK
jgi:hypothetical protein